METCDDQNRIDGDGCSSSCQVEAGFFCAGQQCFSNCGNGQVEAFSNEQCDDNGRFPGDGCDVNCQIEAGFSCVVSPSGPSICRRQCGNGVREGLEQCDDFNVANGDGCSSACVIEPGWECELNFFGRSVCNSETVAYCGNGVFEPENNELCDDGNDVNTDGCTNGCFLDPNFNCQNVIGQKTECTSIFQQTVICLDPTVQLGSRALPNSVSFALRLTSIQATTYDQLVQ